MLPDYFEDGSVFDVWSCFKENIKLDSIKIGDTLLHLSHSSNSTIILAIKGANNDNSCGNNVEIDNNVALLSCLD